MIANGAIAGELAGWLLVAGSHDYLTCRTTVWMNPTGVGKRPGVTRASPVSNHVVAPTGYARSLDQRPTPSRKSHAAGTNPRISD